MKTTEQTHGEQQAQAQCESILEMVRALTADTAAEDYVAGLTLAQCNKLLAESEVSVDDSEDEENVRITLAEAITDETIEPDGFEHDAESAQQRIQEDPLSLEVRSDWQSLGEPLVASEFCILLCTGGPAVRIIGDLDNGQPSHPRIEHQDWGTPWTEYFPTAEQREALQTYCEQFCFEY